MNMQSVKAHIARIQREMSIIEKAQASLGFFRALDGNDDDTAKITICIENSVGEKFHATLTDCDEDGRSVVEIIFAGLKLELQLAEEQLKELYLDAPRAYFENVEEAPF